jgi:hypothetical protein
LKHFTSAVQLVDGDADLQLGELRFQERESSPAADAATARNERLAPLAMDLPMKVSLPPDTSA